MATFSKLSSVFLLFLGLAQLAAAKYNIEIRFTNNNISPSVREAFRLASERWGEVITTDVRDMNFRWGGSLECFDQIVPFGRGEVLDDLLILTTIGPIDGPGDTLGGAAPCHTDTRGYARLGIMIFDEADMASLEKDGTLNSVILHEMGHVIGIGTKWEQFNRNYEYTGAGGIRGHELIGGSGRPLIENTGKRGTKGGHWRESTYQNELMTGYVDPTTPFSSLTVEALTDLGYSVNSAAADDFVVPSGGFRSGRSSTGHEMGDDILNIKQLFILNDDGVVVGATHHPDFVAAEETSTNTGTIIATAAAIGGLVAVGSAFVVYKAIKNTEESR